MSAWLRDDSLLTPGTADERRTDIFALLRDDSRHQVAQVTAPGARWLASAEGCPRSMLALWETRPTAPAVLPCGTAFDVVNAPAIFGRHMLDRLWEEGPGSGPVAMHRGRMMLFSAPGTAHRLPALLGWEEWGDSRAAAAVPRHRRRGDRSAAAERAEHPGTPLAGGPGHPPSLAPRARGTALGMRPGGPRRRPARTCAYRFFLAAIRMLRSTTSAGAASSVG